MEKTETAKAAAANDNAFVNDVTARCAELQANPEKRDAMTLEERSAYIMGYDSVEAYNAAIEEIERKRVEKNAAAANLTIMERLDGRGFVSVPGDVFEIIHKTSSAYTCLSGSIEVRLINGETESDCCLANKLDTWQWLKDINEIPARKVEYVTITSDDCERGEYREVSRVPYEESAPYKFRFRKTA